MSEHHEQVALIDWARSQEAQIPELALLYANPLGGKRPKRTAVAMRAEGAKAGVPDLSLPVARGGWFGLFIEMKFGRNKTTPAQDWWIEKARDLILAYLSKPPTP